MSRKRPYNNGLDCELYEPTGDGPSCYHTDNATGVCRYLTCPRLGEAHYERDQINTLIPVLWDDENDEWSFELGNGQLVILPGESLDANTHSVLEDLRDEQHAAWHKQHTDECNEMLTKTMLTRRRWIKKWPNYCRSCEGTGGFDDPPVHYYQDGSGYPGGWDECECVAEGQCPRCGEVRLVWLVSKETFDAYLQYTDHYRSAPAGDIPYCPCCGWIDNPGVGSTPGAPQEWECDCWIERDREFATLSPPAEFTIITPIEDPSLGGGE